VIGAGKFGSLHAKAFFENLRSSLVAVVDTDASRAKSVAGLYGSRPYTNLDEMLSKEKPDAVSIATPEGEHKVPVVMCAKAGVDIFLEKPLAMTMEDADEIEKACRKARINIMLDFILRFDSRYSLASELARSGRIGKVVCVYLSRIGTSGNAEFYGKRADLLRSTTVHDIDYACWVMNSRVKRVYGESVSVAKHGKDFFAKDDGLYCTLKFGSGAIGSIHTSAMLPESAPAQISEYADIIGTGGEITISKGNEISVLEGSRYSFPDTNLWPVISDRLFGALRESIDCFLDCSQSKRTPPVGIKEGRRSLQIALAVGESIRKSRPIEIT